jgi:protein phosphatase
MEDWSKHLQIASISDVGMRRATNQDSYEVSLAGDMQKWNARGHLFLVADGMGAHAAGELASKLAADGITHLYAKHQDLSPPEALKRAVEDSNAEINRRGQANEEFKNMGTTCSALTLLPQGAVVAHVGDSRVYRMRSNRLEQLTRDHSLVWEMREKGNFPEGSKSLQLIPKNVITRSLGPYPDVNVDLEGPHPIQVGDVFLLCSDGLSGEGEDDEMASLLSHLEPERAARMLVDLANLRGGPDNITVIVIRVCDQTLATSESGSPPLTVGGKKEDRAVGPIPYTLLTALVIAALLCMVMNNGWVAILLGLFAAGIAGYITFKLSGAGSGEKVVGTGKRFGLGPYTRTQAVSGSNLLAKLDKIGTQLRNVAEEEDLPVDLGQFDNFFEKAKVAAAESNEAAAMNFFCSGLSNYMDQLRG